MRLAMIVIVCLVMGSLLQAQERIPASYTNLIFNDEGDLVFVHPEEGYFVPPQWPDYPVTYEQMRAVRSGSDMAIHLDFQRDGFEGTLVYGLIPYGDSKHPQPVFFKRPRAIQSGKAVIPVKSELKGKYDMVGWQDAGKGVLGYRVMDAEGMLLYDGRVAFTYDGTFTTHPTVIEGPLVAQLYHDAATLRIVLNEPAPISIQIDGRTINSPKAILHELDIENLEPDTEYAYSVTNGPFMHEYSFRTAPAPGTRKPFTFAYASDSRNAAGGGERNLYGVNAYMMKRIAALAHARDARFFQFSGDLIDGYLLDTGEQDLQYANWKRSVEQYWHYIPFIAAMGNHEALMHVFKDGDAEFSLDRFPYETESAEAVFARNFTNPEQGPPSEDASKYDPDKAAVDFPSYSENVFAYQYDNVAVVVLNSDYWYAPGLRDGWTAVGGNLHGYIMDVQMQWLKETIAMYENDENIDHVFITLHTPFFPNGGHVKDDMWYHGDNSHRPIIAGKPVEKGIIERRDELLDIIVNQSEKVLAILTGDEHNYNRLTIDDAMPRYPENYEPAKLPLRRTIYQINNGAAGAPYYAQEETPWSANVSGFTTQNAVVFFHVDGDSVELEVRNPETLELIDETVLR
ncbi:MAG: hypothetical protein CL946_07350 [Ectothiorhodospiraceae bacterium]|nr:hypothetical protein [Ectothiorhodospiraceae bacterium]